ncbi:MAG TPA: DUF2231 domain-containing protein [Candidatus Kapabacteria bacterium]|jgi:uncharacterized membrane protein/nitrite reductase/ring-hydroxylating ferredoxin subunit|nr:DUF2231 domain-containing protein [Candidatus Kapabacteria bacterium]
MRSSLHVKGHPVHPMLIPFPIAFLTGALASDIVGLATVDPTWSIIASRLAIAGIVMALVAAVPGLIDYFTAVPPSSTGKSRATKHMLLNISVVVSFFIANELRTPGSLVPGTATLVLEIIGFCLLAMAGWMGGTLAYRNQIGVDHRYANAGKWNSSIIDAKGSTEIEVAKDSELKTNQMKLIEVAGKRIVIGRTEVGFVAFDDHCSHRGGSLADGVMICGTIQCPWHGSQFDCTSGLVKSGPAMDPIATYPVHMEGNRVMVQIHKG